MINIQALKEGNIVRILVDKETHALKAGDTLRVVKVGYSGWDRCYYADMKTDKNYPLDIYGCKDDYKYYELVC
jgi:hypothetical protein